MTMQSNSPHFTPPGPETEQEVERGVLTEAQVADHVRNLLRVIVCFGWMRWDIRDKTIPLDDPDTREV